MLSEFADLCLNTVFEGQWWANMLHQHSNSKYQSEYYLENKFDFFFRKSPIFSSNLTVTNSHNKVITVNYVSDTLSNANGWMSLLLDQEIYTLSFSSPLLQRNLQVMKFV